MKELDGVQELYSTQDVMARRRSRWVGDGFQKPALEIDIALEVMECWR